ncbi:response regulator transcription factor [Christensenellaceae bacterium OttesenSCG-928-K19]|nr:response regulator transcription factor [Christensenellaceae bacterium OttesenSCG-928-K19]
MRILVVEDEPDLNKLIVKILSSENYAVDCCLDGQEALDYIKATEYDGIILDIMLPSVSGLDILKKMRKDGNDTPVLLLTAKDSIDNRVSGLDMGADDYLVKPFAYEELLARLRVLLRGKKGKANLLEMGGLSLDPASHRVFLDGDELFLSGREFAILEYMLRNQGIVLSRTRIEEHIWSYEYEGSSNVVDVYIRKLRSKLCREGKPSLIHTVRNVGYVMRESE